MKRFLSIILALAMTLTLIPAVSAETGDTYVFEMYNGYYKTETDKADIGDDEWLNATADCYITYTDKDGNKRGYVSDTKTNLHTGTNFWTTVSVVAGNEINGVTLAKAVTTPRFRLFNSSAESKSRYITFKFKVGATGVAKNYTIKTETYMREFCGSYAVYANNAYLGTISNYAAAQTALCNKVDVTDFNNVVRLIPDENGYVSLTFYALTKQGTYGTTNDFVPLCITFTEVADAGNYLDSVSVGASVKNSVGGEIETDDIEVGIANDVAVGKEISLKAVADTGYKFAYWTDSEGRALSEEVIYNFKAYCNTAVYAVFNKVNDTSKIGVDFFDGNRDYLGFKSVASGTLFGDVEKPAYGITGYTFKGWSIDNDTSINSFLRAVALYEKEGIELTSANITVNGASQGTKKYGEKVECNDDNATAWYLNDKLVAYGKTYTHLAWGSVAITSKSNEIADKAPAVVLNANGDAYMMEYDKGDYEILEAGILFGNDTHKTLSSCYTKAKVKDIADHGYFTAKIKVDGTANMQTVARGYVVYKNGDGICVKYSD